MREAVHAWKQKWSEDSAEIVGSYVAEIFRIYEKEERREQDRD